MPLIPTEKYNTKKGYVYVFFKIYSRKMGKALY